MTAAARAALVRAALSLTATLLLPASAGASGSQAPGRPRISALLGGSIRRGGSPAAPLSGAMLELELPVLRALALAADFRVDSGRADADPAPVEILATSVAAHLLIGQHTGRWRWGAGPGARLGWLRLETQPGADSALERRTVTGLWGGPGIGVRAAHAFLPRRLILSLGVDGGLIVLPVSSELAPGRELFAMDGGWMGVSIAGGLDF